MLLPPTQQDASLAQPCLLSGVCGVRYPRIGEADAAALSLATSSPHVDHDEHGRAIAGTDNPTSADVVLLVLVVHVSDDTTRADETPAARRQHAVPLAVDFMHFLRVLCCVSTAKSLMAKNGKPRYRF